MTNKIIKSQVFENSDKFAIVLENVFTKEECEEWIEMTEKKGYDQALVNVGYGRQKLMTDVRNNDRCIIDSEELADKLYQRIKDYIPDTFRGCNKVSLNERLRFLRYYVNQEFKWHYDGCYYRQDGEKAGERSYVTVQLYLNQVEDGGCTSFSGPNEDIDNTTDVVPKIGSVLIFEHHLLHCGMPVNKGKKYCVRTDVMYKPQNKSENK